MAPFTAYLESFIGSLLTSQRGRDAQLLTRATPAMSSLPPTMIVISTHGPSPAPLLFEHTPLGDNLFPNLSWSLPADVKAEDVKTYLLVVEDPDAPLPSPIVHGLYHDFLPDKTSVGPDDFLPASTRDTGSEAVGAGPEEHGNTRSDGLAGGFRYGANRKKTVWGGPKPVLGHGPHRYFFQVVALNSKLQDPGESLSKEHLQGGGLDGKVLAWGEWVGTFERKLE